MKKKSVIIVVIVVCLALAGSVISYGYFRKPKSSKELAMKSVMAMKDTKEVEFDGKIDASASAFDSLTLPLTLTFDGNYNLMDQKGSIDVTTKTNVFNKDFEYSDHIDFPEESEEKEEKAEGENKESLSEEEKEELLALLEKSEFNYDKENGVYTISIATKDVLSVSSVREKLFGEDSLFASLNITEDAILENMNDDSKIIAQFNKEYYLTKIELDSMDLQKEFDLSFIKSAIDIGKIPAKVSFNTEVNFKNYIK